MHLRGFSLIELSIALVIIGLIVGGITTGASLIRNSEVKSVISEYNKYKQAAISFRGKYAALPGDLTDATSYWASASNGNGDGQIAFFGAGAGLTSEWAEFWKQLALAGLIEGSYTGTAGALGGSHVLVGTNSPKSALKNAGWSVFWIGIGPGDANNFSYDYGNVFGLGGNVALNAWAFSPVLKPEEAWNLDIKLDDGMPGAGKMIIGNIASCANATSSTDYAATYQLNSSAMTCIFYFTNVFND